MTTRVYDRHGKTIRKSANLRGVLAHYSAKPDDIVVKVVETGRTGGYYKVTFFWPHSGDEAITQWADWRVLLDWLRARRSWSIARVTFDAPLYDKHENDSCFCDFRKACAPLTRHAYQN